MRTALSVGLLLVLAGCTGSRSGAPGPVIDTFDVPAARDGATISAVTLEQGATYVVTVEGTVSLYDRWHWRTVCGGTPEAKPMFASGVRTGPVGIDPAYEFAMPSSSSVCSRGAPTLRSGWMYRTRPDAEWTLAETDAPLTDAHAYTYRITGEGEPLAVRVRETGAVSDNYGAFRVAIRRDPR